VSGLQPGRVGMVNANEIESNSSAKIVRAQCDLDQRRLHDQGPFFRQMAFGKWFLETVRQNDYIRFAQRCIA